MYKGISAVSCCYSASFWIILSSAFILLSLSLALSWSVYQLLHHILPSHLVLTLMLVPDLVFCHADGDTSFWPIFLAFLLSCLLLSVDPALLCHWCSSPFICLQTVPGLAACVHLCLCTLARPLITLAWPFRFSFWFGHTFIPTSSLGPTFKLEHTDTQSFPSPSGSLICVVS